MGNFAVINNGTVLKVIVADNQQIAEEVTNMPCVESTDDNPANINWLYDEATGRFTRPTVE